MKSWSNYIKTHCVTTQSVIPHGSLGMMVSDSIHTHDRSNAVTLQHIITAPRTSVEVTIFATPNPIRQIVTTLVKFPASIDSFPLIMVTLMILGNCTHNMSNLFRSCWTFWLRLASSDLVSPVEEVCFIPSRALAVLPSDAANVTPFCSTLASSSRQVIVK